MKIEEKNIVKWQKLKIEAQQQTIDKLTKENTKLKEHLKDIKSQLFDVNNCDTILTLAIEQLLNKNK